MISHASPLRACVVFLLCKKRARSVPIGLGKYVEYAEESVLSYYRKTKYGFLNLGVKYRVHYGWQGFPSVWLDDPLLGANLFMKIG